ncbi:MAG: hypothetical protein Q9168_007648, partial [Polycauliona sp. 1 TL-2023]
MVNYYHVLGVADSATKREISDAFFAISQPVNGVYNGQKRDTTLIKSAYKTLCDSESRADYDEELTRNEESCGPIDEAHATLPEFELPPGYSK